jgi:hypothetical protein
MADIIFIKPLQLVSCIFGSRSLAHWLSFLVLRPSLTVPRLPFLRSIHIWSWRFSLLAHLYPFYSILTLIWHHIYLFDKLKMAYKKVSHKKVRTGCDSCKRRRVKVWFRQHVVDMSNRKRPQCDELKPICSGCMRHSLECSYSTTIDTSGRLKHESPDNSPFSFSDFKLMHHWKICTAETLAPNAALQRAMRECIPVLAINHRYLMWIASSRLISYCTCINQMYPS